MAGCGVSEAALNRYGGAAWRGRGAHALLERDAGDRGEEGPHQPHGARVGRHVLGQRLRLHTRLLRESQGCWVSCAEPQQAPPGTQVSTAACSALRKGRTARTKCDSGFRVPAVAFGLLEARSARLGQPDPWQVAERACVATRNRPPLKPSAHRACRKRLMGAT